MTPYNLTQYTSDYKNNLVQFVQECNALQIPFDSKKYKQKNFDAMKISFTPSLKISLAARFDHIGKEYLNILNNVQMQKPIQVNASMIVSNAQNIIRNLKHQALQKIKNDYRQEGYSDEEWCKYGLEKWLDNEINAITMPKNQGTIEDVTHIARKFWKNCSEKWARENNLEKYNPGLELEGRLHKICREMNVEAPDCTIFATCFLKIEDRLKKNNLSDKQFFLMKDYRLVKKPLPNDLIVYLDADNNPIHIGVFLDSTRVISKIGSFSIFKHNPEDEKDANAYVIARKV